MPQEQMRIEIGFSEFRPLVYKKYSAAIEGAKDLVALASKMTTEKAVGEPLHKVIGWLACIVSNSLGAVVTLVLNGYGNDAMRIARSMFEASVNAAYLKLHPQQVQNYIDFSQIRQMRRLEFMKKHAPEQLQRISPERAQKTEDQYASIVDGFRDKKGRIRGSWSPVPLSGRAEEVGMDYAYRTVHDWASSMLHLDFSGLALQTEAVSRDGEDSELFCDVAPSEKWLEHALLIGHGSTLLVLDTYNTIAKLGMDTQIEGANQAFVTAWKKPIS